MLHALGCKRGLVWFHSRGDRMGPSRRNGTRGKSAFNLPRVSCLTCVSAQSMSRGHLVLWTPSGVHVHTGVGAPVPAPMHRSSQQSTVPRGTTLSDASLGCFTTVKCVITKGLRCLHGLAHAADSGQLLWLFHVQAYLVPRLGTVRKLQTGSNKWRQFALKYFGN